MKLIRLILKMILTVHNMFFTGENIKNIKSMCSVEYANYLDKKKNIQEAKKYYNKAIILNDNNYYAYCGLASALLREKQLEQAIEYSKKANAIKPSLWGYITLYIIYDSLGEADLAKEVFQHILKYYKNMAAVYNQLSYTYFKLGMYKEAENYCKAAIKIEPGEVNIHYNLANVYLSQEKYQEARDEFNYVLCVTHDKRYKKLAMKRIEKIRNLVKSNSTKKYQ